LGARIIGTGSHLPEKTVTNEDLSRIVETSDEWIVKRTGIRTRHLLERDESPADMGVAAGKAALEAAGIPPEGVDLLLVATT